MLYAGLDLSRRRLETHVLDEDGGTVAKLAVHPDADGLRSLAERFASPVTATIETMNGARFVRDELERHGWDVLIADAARVKGLAPLAAKTDKVDARVLAILAWRDLVPAVWLVDPDTRAARERARYRLYLVRHRTSIKNRVHATLFTFGHTVPVSDLFGVRGRELLDALEVPEPWDRTLRASLERLDALEAEIRGCEAELSRLGADHPYVPLLETVPGIGPILAYTIAAEIGDIGRFASAKRLVGYTGLCPRVYQSGESDRRGSLAKTGPKYLRWALVEAAVHAASHPRYRTKYQRTKRRLGKQRGSGVAQVELARELATAIWYMLTRQEPFRAAGPLCSLVA